MAIFNFLFDVICLSILFSLEIKAATLTFKSSEPETAYLEYGRTLNLNVSYQYDGNQAVSVTWSLNGADKIRVSDDGSVLFNHDPLRAKIIGQASLQLMNTNFSDNGTFRVTAYAGDAPDIVPLDFKVIIQVQPVANISCTTPVHVTEGGNFSCICYGVNGSPPPNAYWLKDNNPIPITKGYLSALLDIRNASKNDHGTYTCRVRSGTLIDEQQVDITVLYGPTFNNFTSNATNNIAQVGDYVKLTCLADGYPKPSYNITFVKNQTFEQVLTNIEGILIINNVNISDVGTYRCVAKNNFGSKEAELVINVTTKTTQSTTTASTTVPTSSTNKTTGSSSLTSPVPSKATSAPTGDKEESNSNIAPIVGGAIGGLVFLIILIVLIWYCCCKRSVSGSCKRGDGGEEDIVVNPANPSYAAMGDSMDRGNPYESVDQAKIDQARAADEAGPSNENPPDAGNGLPPVYAVVDKLKKTPKPPPEKQPDSLTYASLDPVVLQPDSSKMRDRTREETNYASIDLLKLKKDQE